MLIVLCYKYLIMHVHIVQSDFHVRHIPFRGITARTPPFPISWSPPPLVLQILRDAGLCVNLAKSVLEPTQLVHYLEVSINFGLRRLEIHKPSDGSAAARLGS